MNSEDKININVNSLKSLYITIYYNETKLGTASGFMVKEKDNLYLITNRHVVTGRNNQTNECLNRMAAIPNKLKVWIPQLKNNEYIWSNVEIKLYKENKPLWFEHRKYGSKVDVIAIYLGKDNINTFFYSLNSNYKTIVTEQLYIVGYPFGYEVNPQNGKYAIWTYGSVASDPDLDINIEKEQLSAFLIDARTRSGQSGSPVIYYSNNGMIRNNNGFSIYGSPITEPVGIYSGRINKESDLGYVWKWKILKEIINQ